jgi:hypothetical protein
VDFLPADTKPAEKMRNGDQDELKVLMCLCAFGTPEVTYRNKVKRTFSEIGHSLVDGSDGIGRRPTRLDNLI